jgi:AcrR family transcriptional regulator
MSVISKPNRKDLTHDKIVGAAARSIRTAGCDGVGVAEIMKQAGLTHGGFYAHFDSRDAMLAEALLRAGQESAANMRESIIALQSSGVSAFRALIETYLSDRHIASADGCCVVAVLLSELPRQSPAVRETSTLLIDGLLAAIRRVLPEQVDQNLAPMIASAMVGALQLARSLGDTPEGRKHLFATRTALIAEYDAPATATKLPHERREAISNH